MFVIDRSLYLSPEVVGEPGPKGPLVAEPFSRDLHGFVAWMETQDGETLYDPNDFTSCLICRFASAIAGEPVFWIDACAIIGRPAFGADDCWADVAYANPYAKVLSISGALSRARKLLAEREK